MLNLATSRKLETTIGCLNDEPATVYFTEDSQNQNEFEVCLVTRNDSVNNAKLIEIHKERAKNSTRQVTIVVSFNGKAQIYGPALDRQALTVPEQQAQRVLQAALQDRDFLSARRSMVGFLDSYGNSEMAGVKNKGLFASHHLRENLPQRSDWNTLKAQGAKIAKKRHNDLITALGFTVAKHEKNTQILTANGAESRVVAVLLDDAENFESPGGRFPSSPIAWGLAVAAENNVPWLIALKKDRIRLHPGKDGVGVGQKGQAETYLELNLAQIDDDLLALLPLIFSANALARDGEVQKILDESSKFAVTLGARLRERVYESVVPTLSIAVAKRLQQQDHKLDNSGLQNAYSISLKILFRLLFQAYAEDRGLLPAGRNESFDANSLKTIAKRNVDTPPEMFGEAASLWFDLAQVWNAIDVGNPGWNIPAYNGGLFGQDPEHHPDGALIKTLELPDSVMGPVLQALLIDMTEDGVRGPVDFRSLSVREFGTIYEGLLESSLSLADVDLTVDKSDAWVPALEGQAVMAHAGEPYFHSASGERKATGSYFTPKFVVDHLVERAIDPTIDKHLEKIAGYLRAGDQATAGREFFDFRVADLAMGSAHFLVAAVDRIEAKMGAFLSQSENQVPGVIDEISRLRKAAVGALASDEIAIAEIEDTSLLRRQIARRCIYGIDINPMAVELARLAIWIHTFVPGLPMSTLNHNLVCANSLTGIGSIDEALDALIPNRKNIATIFDDAIAAGLYKAKDLLVEAANASEADKREVAQASKLAAEAKAAAENARQIFNVAVAARVGAVKQAGLLSEEDILEASKTQETIDLIDSLNPAHMTYLFPEVFLRENGGFDALIGNPPWEKIQLDVHRWWNRISPGIIGMSQNNRDEKIKSLIASYPALEAQFQREFAATVAIRESILRGPFLGLGKSNPDLYQAFVWRNWHLLRAGGNVGLVVPRGALRGSALEQWRREVLSFGGFLDVSLTVNTGGWMFPSVHPQYGVAIVVVSKNWKSVVTLRGPIRSLIDFQTQDNYSTIEAREFATWSSTQSFPNISGPFDLDVLRQINMSPRFDAVTPHWQVRAIQGDMNATSDKKMFDVSFSEKTNMIDIWTGGTFNLWDPNHGKPFANADSQTILAFLEEKVKKGVTHARSPYFNFQLNELGMPFKRPRIAYRWITNQVNSRTCVIALCPPNTPFVNSAPVLIFHAGSAQAESFGLGVMSSIPYDWTIRKWIEMNFTFEALYPSRIPHDKIGTPLGQRLIQVSGRLAAVDERYADWAAEVGVPVGSFKTEAEKNELIAELDALVSLLYGLDESQVTHIFETFHRGWVYKPRLEKVLGYFAKWKDEA